MMREGVIERYLSYNVSEEEEVIWIEELFQSLYIRLQRNINDLNALHQITYLIECHAMGRKLIQEILIQVSPRIECYNQLFKRKVR